MLHVIRYNGKDYSKGRYLSTLSLYKTQKEMDLDNLEKTDRRAIRIINNNVSFKIVKDSDSEAILNFIKVQGENLFNTNEVQNYIYDVENMPDLTKDGKVPTTVL